MAVDLKAVVINMIEIREFCDSKAQEMTEQQQHQLGAFHHYVHCMQLALSEIEQIVPLKEAHHVGTFIVKRSDELASDA